MKVLIAYPFASEIRDPYKVIKAFELATDEEGLRVAIVGNKPEVIIVGNNKVGKKTLELWRSIMINDIELTLIRRGSSLSHIDLDSAKQLNINVLNTLSVNSRFVADYMIEHLHLLNDGTCSTIAIIGSGAIGGRIAGKLSVLKHQVNIYSPSLTNQDESIRNNIKRRKGLDSPNINISMSPEQAIQNATHVIIAVDVENIINDQEKLSKEFIQLIPNGARIVSVTEFRVFVQGALDILIQRVEKGEITARLDSHSFDLGPIQRPLSSVSVETASAAMKGIGCGEAMDQAVLAVLSNVALEQSMKCPLSFSIDSIKTNEEITIIGSGILGLVTALLFSENGYKVSIIDEHNRPDFKNNLYENEISCRGTTLDGCDARHASITETMPHAVFYRKDCLGKYSNDNGWRIIPNQFNEQEKIWMHKFNDLAIYPELIVNLLTKFVSNINRRGIELWKDIFQIFPQISENIIRNERIIRICPTLSLLNAVSSFQTNYHKTDENIQKYNRAEILQRIPNLQLKDGDAGGIEVPGFTINHQQLCANIIQYLETKENVQFKWSTQIQSIDQISSLVPLSSKIILASSLNKFDSPLISNILLAIQGVLGCWIKIPNVNKIKNGFKITEKDPIGVINVTPTCDEQYLYVTGGFAFCGHRGIITSIYLDQLVELFHKTIRNYLPNEMDEYESEVHIPKYCIRPMTPDGMPIITKLNNDQNKKQEIYFIGGTCAGGFVQSPFLATLLLDLIKGDKSDTNLCHIYRSLRLDRNTLSFK